MSECVCTVATKARTGVPDVVTVGEAMSLFVANEPGLLSGVSQFHRVAAGAELNVAVGLSRLGLHVGYVSRLGHDSFGDNLLAFMTAEGIDTRHVSVDPVRPTGFMLKARSIDGSDPTVESFRKGSAASHLSLRDLPGGDFADARHLHLTGISPALSETARELSFALAAGAKKAGQSVSFDPNLRPKLWSSREIMVETLNELARHANIVMPGLAEGEILTGRSSAVAIAEFYLERGAQQVIVKLGPQGAYFSSAMKSGIAPGFQVKQVVDTVGAGDGFAVGVISALLDGLPLEAAASRGNAIGARVVQFPGDSDGLPSREQLAHDELTFALCQ